MKELNGGKRLESENNLAGLSAKNIASASHQVNILNSEVSDISLNHGLDSAKADFSLPDLSAAVVQSQGSSDAGIYSAVLKVLTQRGPGKGNLLDFGAGKGAFLKLLNNTHYNLFGADLYPSQLEGVHWNVQNLNGALQFKDNEFSVVTCIEVIEHLENPRQVVRELYRVLKKDGLLVLTTPNNESWRAIFSYIFRGHFVAFTNTSYPAHITALNRLDMARIFTEAGFDNFEVGFSNIGMLPTFPKLSWQSVSGNQLRGLRYSDNILFFATK